LSANYLRRLTIALCVLVALAISACGGASKTSVELMPNSEQRLESGKSLPISATLANDPDRKGVTWTLTGAGTLVAATETSVMYLAPANISTQQSITITATPVAGGRATSLTIIVVPQKKADTERTEH
jgi:hypothetical protein